MRYSFAGMQVLCKQTRQVRFTQSWASSHGANIWTGFLLTVGARH
jgi:hypothetical protein